MNRLENKVSSLELIPQNTLQESVDDFFRRKPSHGKPKVEKILYAQIAHILLINPQVMIPALLGVLSVPTSHAVHQSFCPARWRAYRLSTAHMERPTREIDVLCFPGAAGEGGIADVGLFLNPSFDGKQGFQIQADLIIYFEIKSQDRHRHSYSQLQAHLSALEHQTPNGVAYLACIGGRMPTNKIDHARWLGHVSLNGFFTAMASVAKVSLNDARLAGEIKNLQLPNTARS